MKDCILRFAPAGAFQDLAVTNINDKLATGSFDLVVLHSKSLPAERIAGNDVRSLSRKTLSPSRAGHRFDPVNVIER
jgi:hypothetical protein